MIKLILFKNALNSLNLFYKKLIHFYYKINIFITTKKMNFKTYCIIISMLFHSFSRLRLLLNYFFINTLLKDNSLIKGSLIFIASFLIIVIFIRIAVFIFFLFNLSCVKIWLPINEILNFSPCV